MRQGRCQPVSVGKGDGKEMKIAYLLLAHKNPNLLRRVIGALSSGSCAFFIHIDMKADIQEFSFSPGDNVFFSEQRIPVHWGDFSQVQATMLLIRQALKRTANYDYFVFMQGSDYPLRSSGYIERYLENNRGREFINLIKMPAPGYPLSKINTLRYPSNRPLLRFGTRVLAKLGLARRDWRKYLGELEPYAGSAWWALSRDACEYISAFAQSHPQVEKYFCNTLSSDEMFFHTILGNSPFRPRVGRSLVYADWSIPGAHPALLADQQVSFFERQDKVWIQDEWGPGEMLFARKFCDERVDLLERIDAMICRKEANRTSTKPQSGNPLTMSISSAVSTGEGS